MRRNPVASDEEEDDPVALAIADASRKRRREHVAKMRRDPLVWLAYALDFCNVKQADVADWDALLEAWEKAAELFAEHGRMPLSTALKWLRSPGVKKLVGRRV